MPHTLSAYYCALAGLILQLSTSFRQNSIIGPHIFAQYWIEVLKEDDMLRCFMQIA
ncbi:hypothetical protein OH966_000866 [Vibrio parahaemolyticus]|uniref:hypothetical protein n=1 Tax=Vibrio parahaemolyticus TaxID=670 RepID=UPI00130D9357|nr:hypothetical protein [Vibrio parahaemolyticus]EJB0394731.1 hypothetical protein [Vibrio parahaemolyticus]EJB5287905.1 hypothetical protein [Vibrio parahaemolyticus]EJG2028024.1 hypothetical protein [Vibrio parahaemolyticus]EJZ3820073.1 hypothetical protein [Vibrio parahaemolyticus]MBM4926053.1 hypothetical protein [Vibrio parahaemolyticus]